MSNGNEFASLPMEAIQWLANGERGLSSNALFTRLTGVDALGRDKKWWRFHPLDPADFRRCVLLLETVPGFREKLPLMCDVSPQWAALVAHWEELEALLVDEYPTGFAPKTHECMREILMEAGK
ncbi:hypothetical protein [Megalodesulfovibrio paquesii]